MYQKPYGENRSLMYFFSKEFGLVHGVGKKNLPLFSKITLFATGRGSLKTFSQSQVLNIFANQSSKSHIAGLYLNELLLKIFGIANVEDAMPNLWQHYATTIEKLFCLTYQTSVDNWHLHFILRHFETVLLDDLGYGIDFSQDFLQNPLQPDVYYDYVLEQGFKITHDNQAISGQLLLVWQNCLTNKTFFDDLLNNDVKKTTKLCREMTKFYQRILNHLLNYQTLKSRELWRQLINYQSA